MGRILGDAVEHVRHVTRIGQADVSYRCTVRRQCRESGCNQVVLAIGGGESVLTSAVAAPFAKMRALRDRSAEDIERSAPLPIGADAHYRRPTTAGADRKSRATACSKFRSEIEAVAGGDQLLPRTRWSIRNCQRRHHSESQQPGHGCMTHLIEGYLSKAAQAITDALVLRGRKLWHALHRLAQSGVATDAGAWRCRQVHDDLALASMWAESCSPMPDLGRCMAWWHRLVVCVTWHTATAVMRVFCLRRFGQCQKALSRRQPDGGAGANAASCALLTDGQTDLKALAERLSLLRSRLGIRSLSEQGFQCAQFARIVSQSRKRQHAQQSDRLSDEELLAFYEQSWQELRR